MLLKSKSRVKWTPRADNIAEVNKALNTDRQLVEDITWVVVLYLI